MEIKRYISVLVVLVVGLFLVNASWPEATFAQVQGPACTTCVQCYAPVNRMERAGNVRCRGSGDSLYNVRAAHECSGVSGGYTG